MIFPFVNYLREKQYTSNSLVEKKSEKTEQFLLKLIPFRIPGGTKKTVGEGGAGDYGGLRTKGSKI